MPTLQNENQNEELENDFLDVELDSLAEEPNEPANPPKEEKPVETNVEKPVEKTEENAPENVAETKEEPKLEEEKPPKTQENPQPNKEDDDVLDLDTSLGSDPDSSDATNSSEADGGTDKDSISEEEIKISDSEVKRENQELKIENSTLERRLKVVEGTLTKAEVTVARLEEIIKKYSPYLSGKETIKVDVNGETKSFQVNKIITEADETAINESVTGFKTAKQQSTYQSSRFGADGKLSKTLGKVAFELKEEGIPTKGLKEAVLGFQKSYKTDNDFATDWLKTVAFYKDEDLLLRLKSFIKKSAEAKVPKVDDESELEKLRREVAELKAKQAEKPKAEDKKPEEKVEKVEIKTTQETTTEDEGELLL